MIQNSMNNSNFARKTHCYAHVTHTDDVVKRTRVKEKNHSAPEIIQDARNEGHA